jgi:hypothetical protein
VPREGYGGGTGGLRSHLRYLSYVLRHKWFVFVECCRLGELWLGLIHDLDKFRPSMWGPYVRAFYRHERPVEEKDFLLAWLGHIHRNPHHWQWWILLHDDSGRTVFEMPLRYRREMLADWRGAGRAQGKPDTVAWYLKNRSNMSLHPFTQAWIEEQLGVAGN